MSKRIASLGALLAASLVVASASADVPPPDSCNTPGAACNTAPPDFKSPGTCVTQKCQKPGPDGGFEVDCDLCQPNAGGAGGGSAGTGGSGTGGSGTGGSGTGGGSGAFWPAAYNASCTPAKSSPGNHSGFSGMECVNCHKQGGTASGKNWQFGGVVWSSAAATDGAPNVEVGVKDGTNFIYACTDSKGFFFADTKNTTAPNWATAEIRIRSATGEKTMLTKAVQAGTCNASACHAGTTKLVKP